MTKQFITSIAFAILSFNLFSQTTEEIVAKHIEAVGGKENWSKVNSIRTEGSSKVQGAEIKLVITQVHKKAMRVDIALMGMNGYQILTTTEGWNFMPFQGQTKPEPYTADDVKNGQEDLDLQDEFITYKEQGKKIENLGKDDVDGTECFKIKLISKDGKESTYYIDPSNYLVIKEVNKVKADGKEIESQTTYSNYKKTDAGIILPMNQGGDMGEMEFSKIEINSKIDDSIFKITK